MTIALSRKRTLGQVKAAKSEFFTNLKDSHACQPEKSEKSSAFV